MSVREMKCGSCGSTKIRTEKEVGCDISEEGEETQHRDVCLGCGADRLWADVYPFLAPAYVWCGKWEKDGKVLE